MSIAVKIWLIHSCCNKTLVMFIPNFTAIPILLHNMVILLFLYQESDIEKLTNFLVKHRPDVVAVPASFRYVHMTLTLFIQIIEVTFDDLYIKVVFMVTYWHIGMH